jgi:L-lactate utilization protein LutC
VIRGNRPGSAAELEERGTIGYQGAGPDPVQRFGAELAVAGGALYCAPDQQAAVECILDLIHVKKASRVLLGQGTYLDPLDLETHLQAAGCTVLAAAGPARVDKEAFFSADLGISGVAYLVAETGSVVVASRPDDPRSTSLLPPIHIAVAGQAQLLPDLFDLFQIFEETGLASLPSGLALITGPSKTGDIELKLVTGVHGPGEVHVILVG